MFVAINRWHSYVSVMFMGVGLLMNKIVGSGVGVV